MSTVLSNFLSVIMVIKMSVVVAKFISYHLSQCQLFFLLSS